MAMPRKAAAATKPAVVPELAARVSSNPRPASAPAAPAPVREAQLGAEIRPPQGRAVALGRDGKPIWRQVAINGEDPYSIDPSLIPDGWIYEWKRYSIYNQVQASYQTSLQRIGKWTPVLKESHDGIFDAPGVKGTIIHEGLMLMERPLSLHVEAQNEEKALTAEKTRRAKQDRGLAAANTGVSTTNEQARSATFIRQEALSLAEMEEIAANRPKYDYERQSID